MKKRIVRETKETRVEIVIGRLAEAAARPANVDTTEPFFDHMLATLARYAGLDLRVSARGDLRHHLMEDTAIALGRALRAVTPPTAARYGERTIPMDDALVQVAVDVGGRAFFAGKLPSRMHTHVLRSLADSLGATLHVRVLAGTNKHHVVEAAYKATGLALRQALAESGELFSTKGAVAWTEQEP